MSPIFGAAGNPPSREQDRRRLAARRRASLGLLDSARPAGTPMWAFVERLEERTLLVAPVVNLMATGLTSYEERAAEAPIAPDATVQDGDNPTTFENGFLEVKVAKNNTTDDVLAVVPGKGIEVDGTQVNFRSGNTVDRIGDILNDGKGTNPLRVGLLSAASPAVVNFLVQQIHYENDSFAPPADVEVRFDLNDGSAADSTGSATRAFPILADNDPPTIGKPGPQTTLVTAPLTFSGANKISVQDLDSADGALKVTLQVVAGTLGLAGTTGLTLEPGDNAASDDALTFTGTLVNVNAALDGLTYRANPNSGGMDTLTIVVNDQGNTGQGATPDVTENVPIAVTLVSDLVATITTNATGSVRAGSVVRYTLTATNFGPSVANGVNYEFRVGTVSGSDFTAFFTRIAAFGSIAADAQMQIVEDVPIPPTVVGKQVVARWSVTHDTTSVEPDPDTNSNSATNTVGVGGAGVLSFKDDDNPDRQEGDDRLKPNIFDVVIRRTAGEFDDLSGEVGVTLSLEGSAVPGTDYRIFLGAVDVTPAPGTRVLGLRIPGGDYLIQFRTVPNETIQADNRTIALSLLNPRDGASLADRQTTKTLTIKEDDSLVVTKFGASSDSSENPSGTLRQVLRTAQALYDDKANTAKAPILITFDTTNVPENERTIALNEELPEISFRIDVNGTPQLSAEGRPTITIDGSRIRSDNGSLPKKETVGLRLMPVGDAKDVRKASTVRGLVIRGFTRAGVEIVGMNNEVLGNEFRENGDSDGADDSGVLISNGRNNTIGGTSPSDRNVISDNMGSGVRIVGPGATGNQVLGNYIGTGANGTTRRANREGVSLDGATGNTVGGAAASARNVISGNAGDGLRVEGADTRGNFIQGNYIGLNADGAGILGNGGSGVVVVGLNGVSGAITASLSILGNVISGNGRYGVALTRSSGVVISGNRIGTSADGEADLGNGGSGVLVRDVTAASAAEGVLIQGNLIAGNDRDAKDVLRGGHGVEVVRSPFTRIAGNTIGGARDLANAGSGVLVEAVGTAAGSSGVQIRGNLISGNSMSGVVLDRSFGVAIGGNRIGTDRDGNGALGNGGVAAVSLVSSGANTIGGTTPDDRNVISGNTASGVRIDAGSSGNRVLGNYIGTTQDGGARLPNGGHGVLLDGAAGNTVGGAAASARNVISGNAGDGLRVEGANAVGNQVLGNYIGTDSNGASPVANGSNGLAVVGLAIASGVSLSVGGNVISGNARAGVLLDRVRGVELTGNMIGVNASGNGPVANSIGGVQVLDSPFNTIGGAIAGAGNVISGNRGHGVLVAGSRGSLFLGNRVGTDPGATFAIGNAMSGIFLSDSADVTIGGSVDGARNVVAGNAGHGIAASGNGTSGLQIIDNLVGIGIGVGSPSSTAPALGNGGAGILVTDAPAVTIFGNAVGANAGHGLMLDGRSSARIQRNAIGTATDATSSLGNQGSGIYVAGSAFANIGDEAGPDAGNVILFNRQGGVQIVGGPGSTPGAEVRGNFIGTNRNAARNLGNLGSGVSVVNASGIVIADNAIGGNLGHGIFASRATGLRVRGNAIGTNLRATTDAGGLIVGAYTAKLGNRDDGIHVAESDAATIGDGSVSGRNVVVNNGGDGIEIGGASNDVAVIGNLIGVARDDAGPEETLRRENENLGHGLLIAATSSGVSVLVSANAISGNRLDGVKLEGARGVRLDGNRIVANRANGVEVARSSPGLNSTRNAISGNVIRLNEGDGVRLGHAADNSASGNAIDGNFGYGIAIGANAPDVATRNTLEANSVWANRNSGVLITGTGATNNTLSRNLIGVAGANLNDGVSILQAGAGNLLVSNTVASNNNNGVLISETRGTRLAGNTIGTDEGGNAGLGNKTFGLILNNSTDTDVEGNVISGNKSHGVVISGGPGGNTLHGNLIGLTRGLEPLGNELAGVFVLSSFNNRIGLPGDGNVIAANKSDGVAIFQGGSNLVQGNAIGYVPTPSGLGDRGNEGDGVNIVNSGGNIVGGVSDLDRNTILANKKSGVEIFGGATPGSAVATPAGSSFNSVLNNVLGAVVGDASFGNKLHGVLIAGSQGAQPSGNFIGSLPDSLLGTVKGNLVAGNGAQGIAIVSARENFVRGNTVVGNALNGIGLNDADANVIEAGNVVRGNGADGIGLVASDFAVVMGNFVEGNGEDGIGLLASGDASILGNSIRDNKLDGVRVEQGSTGNRIGVAGAAPNVIVGNVAAGVQILNGGVQNSASGQNLSTGNVVANNLIGVEIDGSARGNRFGVLLNDVTDNIVGGASPDPGVRNTISGNKESGVQVVGGNRGGAAFVEEDRVVRDRRGRVVRVEKVRVGRVEAGAFNLVRNNFIGTDPTGRFAVPNLNGVYVGNSKRNTISGNVLSGNLDSGVQVFGADSSGNVVAGNLIGSDAAGTRPIVIGVPGGAPGGADVYSAANRQDNGVLISNSAGNVVGPGNRIFANQDGVRILGALAGGNTVEGNQIGPDPGSDGRGLDDRLGNFFGISVDGASQNAIEGNAIERNISVGVEIRGGQATGNTVQRNAVSSNGGYGERLSDGGVRLTRQEPTALVFGVGVYLDSAKGNIIGSTPAGPGLAARRGGIRIREDLGERNTISGNTLVDVFLFNGASGNQIRSNVIEGGGRAGVGEYGVFLFNSAGNLNLVQRKGRFANKIRLHRIAQFREFTGPVPAKPTTVGSLPRGPRGGAPSIPTIRGLGGPSS